MVCSRVARYFYSGPQLVNRARGTGFLGGKYLAKLSVAAGLGGEVVARLDLVEHHVLVGASTC